MHGAAAMQPELSAHEPAPTQLHALIEALVEQYVAAFH
jgi:hypothetical protein